MERCSKCGKYAVLGLAHIHGDPIHPLCLRCTDEFMRRIKKGELKPSNTVRLAKKAA